MNSKEYFEKRALATEKHSKQRSDKYLDELKKIYESIDNQIKKDIESWYKKYAIENEISNIDARKILNSTQLQDYNKYVESVINKSNLTGQNKENLRKKYIKSKIDRLTALQKQVELNLDILTGNYESSAKRHLIENYKQVYSEQAHTFDNAPIFTFNLNFNAFDERAIESIVRTKWSNKDFSTRIWGHNKNMVREMTNILSTGIALGYSVDKMSNQISKRLDVNYSNAKRLIRTESNYVLSEATHDLYRDVELEQYQFLATLDFKTSEICQELDNQIFFVKDRRVGLNCNPMHPNCRSTTIPYLPEYMDENDTRIARDVDGTSYKVPANMDYKSWYQSMVDKKTNMNKQQDSNTNMHKSLKNWKETSSNKSGEIKDLFEYSVNGVNYKVDGKHVVLDYNKEEKQIAEMIAKKYGKNVEMIPRVLYPNNIKTPDFLIDKIKYDLKTPTGSGKNTIYDIVKSSKNQANNFILDLSKTKLTIEEVERQINKIYKSMHTNFVNEIVVFKDMNLIEVYYRK